MPEQPSTGKIHVDSDWKTEAAQEKERLAEQERIERDHAPDAAPGDASFLEVVNLLAMQAAIALGGYQGPGGERIPANPKAAQFQIELLEVLSRKTKGNLTEEESRVLSAVLHELRMHYVTLVTGKAPAAPAKE